MSQEIHLDRRPDGGSLHSLSDRLPGGVSLSTARPTGGVGAIVALAFLVIAAACGGGNGDALGEGEDAPSERARPAPRPAESGPRHTNRLIAERSPYLLQHAHNPVDWYPWGEEALERSRREDRPIFLSVGYSTCHWCHVMEQESFEDEEIAALLNETFVCIKVDREERPDLDQLYMTAVHAMTGRGGWPMTVILTPDLAPFFAGTYFPPNDRGGRIGMRTLVPRIGEAWRRDRETILARASHVREALRRLASRVVGDAETASLDQNLLAKGFGELRQRYDPANGGFSPAPKFPKPHQLRFLLRYALRTADPEATRMVRGTLDALAMGGIHDHLGGGFHRYATDTRWLVPHFEKMLYDQAGLALAYTDAWLATGEPAYEAVARGILDYVIATMTHPEGGFSSAEDADSEDEEGKFYVWSKEEIESVLGPRGSERFAAAYGVRAGGNGEARSSLHLSSLEPLRDGELAASRLRLLEARNRRVRPHLDDKIVAAWNGYMIEAFAHAGWALDEMRYIAAAENAAEFIRNALWREGRLRRYFRDGATRVGAYLDDYAFLGRGYLALYEATFEPRHLEEAIHLARELDRLFSQPGGEFALHGSDAEELIAPVIDIHDGALPSGNSAAAVFLLRLGHLTADPAIEDRGGSVLKAFSGAVELAPSDYLELLSGVDFALGPVTELVIAGKMTDPVVGALWGAVRNRYLPNTVRAFRPADGTVVESLIPYLETQVAIGERATAYVCQDYACTLPVHEPAALIRRLGLD